MAWMQRLLASLKSAAASLPLESGAVAVAVLAIWWELAFHSPRPLHVFLSAVLAVPLLVALTMLRRGARVRPGLHAALAAAAVGAAFAIGMSDSDPETAFAWRVGLALLAAVMLPFVAAAAASPRGDRLVRFADFVRRFSEETTASIVVGAAALLALAVLFFAIQELFGARVEKLGIGTGAAVAGLCALSYLHRLLGGSGAGRVPELWRRLIARVAAPFLAAALGILAVYELWVVLRGELPANLISPLIIGAGAVGFASTLVIESLVAVRGERTLSPAEPHPWTAAGPVRLTRAFNLVLLALLPLAGFALWVRIDQHGLTPQRAARAYALGCLAILAVWGTVRWARRRRPLTWEVPALTAAAALLAAIGPLSVVSLSIRSQADRLERDLARAGVAARTVRDTAPPDPLRIPNETFAQLAGRIDILADLGGAAAFAGVLDGAVSTWCNRWQGTSCLQFLGVAPSNDRPPWFQLVDVTPPADQVVAGVHPVDISLGVPVRDPLFGTLAIEIAGDRLLLRRDGAPWASAAVRLRPAARRTSDAAGDPPGAMSETMDPIPPLLDAAGCARAHAFVRAAAIDRAPAAGPFVRMDLVLLLPTAPPCR
jgi:hypothetical protein